MNIQCGVTQEDTCKTTRNKQAHKSDGKQHGRCEPDITSP